jgi:hypothetical protein
VVRDELGRGVALLQHSDCRGSVVLDAPDFELVAVFGSFEEGISHGRMGRTGLICPTTPRHGFPILARCAWK